MMKRFLLPGCLFAFLFICLSITANAQDSTKKAEPAKTEAVKTATPLKAKPLYRRHRLYPAATQPAATPANTPAVNPAVAAQRAKDSAAQAKTQIDPNQLN